MAEQTSRKPFSFRLPWLIIPAPVPTRPPTQQATPPSPSSTAPSRLPSQPPSPSLTASPPSHKVPSSPQSQKTSKPPSPSHTPQLQPAAQTASSPPSPPGKAVTSPSHTASQPPSPSHTASQQTPGIIPPSLSPFHTAPEEQPKALATSQTSSPTLQAPSPPAQASSHPSLSSKKVSQPPSPLMLPAAQDEPALPQPPSQKPQSLIETSSKHLSPSQNKNQIRATTNPDEAAKHPSRASDQVVSGTASSREIQETPFLQETSPKAEETKSEQKTSLEPKREKPKPSADKEPKQRTITELSSMASGLSTKTKGHQGITPQEREKQRETQAALDGKEKTDTGFKERKSKVVTAYPKERIIASESRPKSTAFLGERDTLQREIREDISKFSHKLAVGDPKQVIDEKPGTVITLAGENRGAAMHVGTESAKREGTVHIHRGYKLNQYDTTETTTDGEGSSQRRMEDPKMGEKKATSAYVNSNAQSINNSIILNSPFGERNPGAHLTLSQKPNEPINMKEKRESSEAKKAESNISPAQKLASEPTVRRRCLRSLFLESSDTDQNNPEKPRRHGCRYSCEKKKNKDKQTGSTSTK